MNVVVVAVKYCEGKEENVNYIRYNHLHKISYYI